MCVANVRKHGHIGLHHVRKARHLPKKGNAHFDHGSVIVSVQTNERNRNADLPVHAARRFEYRILPGERGGEHFLRRCLANAAGDADKRNIPAFPARRSDLLHGCQRVRYDDARLARCAALFAQYRKSAFSQHVGDIPVSIRSLAAQRKEKAPLPRLPAVGHDGRGRFREGLFGSLPFAAAGAEHFADRHSVHFLYFFKETSMIFSHSSP